MPKTNDGIQDILNTPDKAFNLKKKDNDKPDDDNRRRKLVIQSDSDIDLDPAQALKMREDTINKIEAHITAMKKLVKEDNLEGYMLQNKIDLLEKAKYMLGEYMITVLTQLTNSSRAYEVLAKMFETIAGINSTILNEGNSKGKIKEDDLKKIIADTNSITRDIVRENIEAFVEEEKFRQKKKDEIIVVKNVAEGK